MSQAQPGSVRERSACGWSARALLAAAAAAAVVAAVAAPTGRWAAPLPRSTDAKLAMRPVLAYAPLASEDSGSSADALDVWLAQGELPFGLTLDPAAARIDGLWFWINGSDVRHRLARAYYAAQPEHHAAVPETHAADEPEAAVWVPSAAERDADVKRELGIEPHSGDRSGAEFFDAEAPEEELRAPDDGSSEDAAAQGLQNTANRFRDSDELRFSLRSARAAFGDALGTQHVVSTDFWPSGLPRADVDDGLELCDSDAYQQAFLEWAEDATQDEAHPGASLQKVVLRDSGGLVRHGQVPQWLNLSSSGVQLPAGRRTGEAPLLSLHFDWMQARPLSKAAARLTASGREALLRRWRLATLPTFNSMSAEAVMGLGIEGLSEFFFYSNDDQFFQRTLSAADFFTPLYGPVLRLDPRTLVEGDAQPAAAAGEGPSLFWSNHLISQRFGRRPRHWFYHFQKVYSLPHIVESRRMFAFEFDTAAASRFRGSGILANSHFITHHLIIERHREALLWSYLVLRACSSPIGRYSPDDLARIWRELGAADARATVEVPMPRRSTLRSMARNLERYGSAPAHSARTHFSSMDGSASARLPADAPDYPWPRFPTTGRAEPACRLDLALCWPGDADAATVFKRFAFELPAECGDCLVALLVGKSGPRGLSAFLPQDEHRAVDAMVHGLGRLWGTTPRQRTAVHLPLDADWRAAAFGLRAVAALNGWRLDGMRARRRFALGLIHRYSYTIADDHAFFWSCQDPDNVADAVNGLRDLREQGAAPSMVCLNDDLTGDAAAVQASQALLHGWMRESFPHALPYEAQA